MPEQRLIDAYEFHKSLKEQYEETKKLIQNGERYLDTLSEGILKVYELLSAAPTVNAVVLPCKVGDTVYEANPRGIVSEYTVRCFKLCSDAIFVLNGRMRELKQENDGILEDCAELQAERDAAVADLPHNCETCTRASADGEPCETECGHCYGNVDAWNVFEDRWQWRGVREGAK